MRAHRFTTLAYLLACLSLGGFVHAATYYVDPVNGNDINNGTTIALAVRTIDRADQISGPGDTVNLRGYQSAAGHYPSGYFGWTTWSGTSDVNRITVQSYPGETAVFDAGYAAFKAAPNTAWTPCLDVGAHPDEYVSTTNYPSIEVSMYMSGMFLDPVTFRAKDRLMRYHRIEDMRATNESGSDLNVLLSDPRPGFVIAGQPTLKRPWVYKGPGMWWDGDPNATDKRIHIRLSSTHSNTTGVTDYVSTPSSTVGTDPRTIPLSVVRSEQQTYVSANYITFKNINFQSGGQKLVQVEKDGVSPSGLYPTFDHCNFLGGRYLTSVGATEFAKFLHCKFNIGLANHVTRSDIKDIYDYIDPVDGVTVRRNDVCEMTGGILMLTPEDNPYENKDIEIAYCEFRNAHDGIQAIRSTRPRIHHNLFENIHDDVIQSDGRVNIVDGRLYQNVFRKCLLVLHHANGNPATSGVRYYYRNIIDLRVPTLGVRRLPGIDPPNSDIQSRFWRRGEGFKMNSPIDSFYCYQNTFIQASGVEVAQLTAGLSNTDLATNNKTRRFMNNIHMTVEGDKGHVDKRLHQIPNPAATFQDIFSNGNNWVRRTTYATSPLYQDYTGVNYQDYAALALSSIWASYQSEYGVGWDANSRFDYPQFNNVPDFAPATSVPYPNTDYRLKTTSPARGVGVNLTGTGWPDSESADSTPDIGAIPFGGAVLAVGVDGLFVFPDTTTPIAEAGDYSVISDANDNGFETVSLTATGSTDPDGTISSYAWVYNGVTVSTSFSFSYEVPIGTHQFFLTVTDNSGKTASDMREVTVSDPDPRGNLVKNPGFETDLTSWSSSGGGTTIVTTPVHFGAKAVRHQGGSQIRRLWQNVPVAPGASIKFSGWINRDAIPTGSKATYKVTWLDINLATISTVNVVTNLSGTFNWTYHSATYTSPANAAYAQVNLRLPVGTGTFNAYWDDIRVRHLDSKVKNGNFEFGLATNWNATLAMITSDTTLVYDGAQAHEMVGSPSNLHLNQDIPVTASTPYYIEAWVKTTAPSGWPAGKNVYRQFLWKDINGVQIGSQTSLSVASSVQPYTRYSETVTSPAGAVTLQLNFVLEGGATGGNAYVDGVYMR